KPLSFVVVMRVSPVSVLRTVTLAFGIAAAELSTVRPEIDALPWANAFPPQIERNAIKQRAARVKPFCGARIVPVFIVIAPSSGNRKNLFNRVLGSTIL